MKFTIQNKVKKELFIAIFQTLKNCNTILSLVFKKDGLFVQGMDKSHVCMFELFISQSWFHTYENQDIEKVVSLDSQTFFTVLNVVNDNYSIEIYQKPEEDNHLSIDLITMDGVSGEFSKYFKLPLTDTEHEILFLPDTEYDADFSIAAKKICEITSQMLLFGSDIDIECTEEKIKFITDGITGEMTVNIPIDDLKEYSIAEGEIIHLKYSLTYISKMCLTNKLSQTIDFSISADYPMKIRYDLGEESSMTFFIAHKIGD
jgi:proliferating cell nuclear antigen PCNA